MHLTEELAILGPVFALFVLLPFFYWRKTTQQQWISIFSIDLAKEWHKPNTAYVSHVRSQSRNDVIRGFQQDAMSSFSLQPFDDLKHKLTSMEDSVDAAVRPIWTPWLCLLVLLEILQYMAVPFASKIHWDLESDWKFIPNVFSCFLTNPSEHHLYDFATWFILAPLYTAVFYVFWMIILGLSMRWLCFGEETRECLASAFVNLMRVGRHIFISIKELFFDFGSLFVFTAIVRSLYNPDGRLEIYWPSSVVILLLFFVALLWSDEGTISVRWMRRILRCFYSGRAQHVFRKIPQGLSRLVNNRELQHLRLYVACHSRPTFASRWVLFTAISKIIIAVLFVFAHFEEFWAWVLLIVSSMLFVAMLHQSIKYGPCTFQWINVLRNMGLVAALWGNLCGVLAQSFHTHQDVTYAFTPTVVFVTGLGIILGSSPFCILVSQRLFTCSPVRLHPLKLQVIHAYFKFIAMGRIASMQKTVMKTGARTDLEALLIHQKFHGMVTEEIKLLTKRLLIHHELWVTWIKKNSQVFKTGHFELSMQEKMHVCSNAALVRCVEDCPDLQTIQKIKGWMQDAEMIVDPTKDIELGLRVPDDAYLSFEDGVPIFIGLSPTVSLHDCVLGDVGGRVFSEKSLCVFDVASPRSRDELSTRGEQEIEAATGDRSPVTSASVHPPSNISRVTRSWGSYHSIQQPCPVDHGERPNRVGSMQETTHSYSSASIRENRRCPEDRINR